MSADLSIDTLENLLKLLLPYCDIFLIGISLGGFYSTYLSEKYNLKAVVINPLIYPNE